MKFDNIIGDVLKNWKEKVMKCIFLFIKYSKIKLDN